MSNNVIVGCQERREPRRHRQAVPFVDILAATAPYTSFGSEPFTPNNELRYDTFHSGQPHALAPALAHL
jgi:hypothetical protein